MRGHVSSLALETENFCDFVTSSAQRTRDDNGHPHNVYVHAQLPFVHTLPTPQLRGTTASVFLSENAKQEQEHLSFSISVDAYRRISRCFIPVFVHWRVLWLVLYFVSAENMMQR